MNEKEFEPIPGVQYDEWEIFPEYWSRCEYCGLRYDLSHLYYITGKENTGLKFCMVCLDVITSEHEVRKWR
jgi:hypothetical protein